MSVCWSVFNVVEKVGNNYIIKNMMTRSVVKLSHEIYEHIDSAISKGIDITKEVEILMGDNSIIVNSEADEISIYYKSFLTTRDTDTDTFTLHFLPTILCQLSCHYCFENGGDRMRIMSDEIVYQSIKWVDEYLKIHVDMLTRLKVVLFGGEPLLGFKVIKKSLPEFFKIAKKYNVDFVTEIVTNGEFLTPEIARFLSNHNLNRLQITLDGPKDLHDKVRFGSKGKPTFDSIISNILMIINGGYIESIDLRINYENTTQHRIPELLNYIADLGIQHNIELSFGILVPTFDLEGLAIDQSERNIAESYVDYCKQAQELGFNISDEYGAGPWCVAIEKHSVTVQPDGSLQKCISTVGRKEYNFSDVSVVDFTPASYAKDARYENFKRSDKCRAEKCSYIPVCGGGCPWDSLVKYGEKGFGKRFCQKTMIDIINRGLIKLSYSQ